jgi:hypothetical protein
LKSFRILHDVIAMQHNTMDSIQTNYFLLSGRKIDARPASPTPK